MGVLAKELIRTAIKTFISHSGSELKLEFEYHLVKKKKKSVKSNTLRIIMFGFFFCAIEHFLQAYKPLHLIVIYTNEKSNYY